MVVFLLPFQVVYPVFVAGMVCRVIFSRVRPAGGGMTFSLTKKDDYYASSGRRCRRFFSRVLTGALEWEMQHQVKGAMLAICNNAFQSSQRPSSMFQEKCTSANCS